MGNHIAFDFILHFTNAIPFTYARMNQNELPIDISPSDISNGTKLGIPSQSKFEVFVIDRFHNYCG